MCNVSVDVQIVTRVSGPEVGYVTTPIAVVESALTILDERVRGRHMQLEQHPWKTHSAGSAACARTALRMQPKLPLRGVLTPAAAFRRSTLIDRLHANGVQFNVISKSA